MRTCLAVVAMCCVTSAAWSQTVIAAAASKPSTTRAATPPAEPQVVRMTVSAQDAPDPALKYELLPPMTDRTPGNAILMYYVAQQVVPDSGSPAKAQSRRDQVRSYLEMPLSELPAKEVEAVLADYATALRQIEIGAMRKDADWGLPLSEGISMPLPPLNPFRDLARVLALRARLQIAQGRFDQAIHTIQIGMALGRHMSGPTLINAMVSRAIEALMLDCVQELIGHGGPNMYWALARLPEPLVDVRQAYEYEGRWLIISHPEFEKAMKGPVTPEEGTALLRRMMELYTAAWGSSDAKPGFVAFGPSVLASRYYGIGKKKLIEGGRTREEVDAMPVGQVVAVYLMEDYVHWRDELFKWYTLPYPQAREGLGRAEQEFQKWGRTEGVLNPLALLTPSFSRSYFVQARLDRARAALQTIEAIRIYAARHGRLPAALDQLDLPAPFDPVTGLPFQYEAKVETFTLTSPSPQGAPKDGVRYEVQLTPGARSPAATTAPAASPATLPAEGPWRGIDRFIQEGTIAVVRIDLAALTSDAAWKQVNTLVTESKLGEPGEQALKLLSGARDLGQKFVEAGAAEVFIVINIADLPQMPMVILPLRKDADADKIEKLMAIPPGGDWTAHRACGALVFATEREMQALRDSKPAPQPRLMKALASCGGAVQVAVAFSDETRRALEETLGTLPPELGNMPGTTLTRGLQWASLDLAVQPEISLWLVIQSQDAASATALGTIIDRCLDSLTSQAQAGGADAAIKGAIGALPRPQVQGDQLVLQRSQAQLVPLLRDVLAPALKEARAGAMRKVSAANMHMIVQACYLWAASHQDMFPPDLQTLVKAKMLPQGFSNPLRPQHGLAGYVYLPPAAPLSKADDQQMVLYEAHEQFGEGVNVGYVGGGVVMWIAEEATFKRLLKAAEANNKMAIQPASQPASP